MSDKNTGDVNKNEIKVSKEKMEKLGILKVLSIVIAENEEVKYNCIMEDGSKEVFSASKLL